VIWKHPQRLKPLHFCGLCGAAEAAPFRNSQWACGFAYLARATVYTWVSSWEFCGWTDALAAGKAGVTGEDESQGVVGGFGDADARGDLDTSCRKGVFADPQAGSGRGEIASIIADAGDAEGLSEASGAAGEARKIAWAGHGDSVDAEERFKGAEKNTSGLAFALTGDIQAVVIAVDEINVSVAGRAEEDGVARGMAGGGVSGGIIGAEVGLDFDDAPGKTNRAVVKGIFPNGRFAD
jgi:hypothetical protein